MLKNIHPNRAWWWFWRLCMFLSVFLMDQIFEYGNNLNIIVYGFLFVSFSIAEPWGLLGHASNRTLSSTYWAQGKYEPAMAVALAAGGLNLGWMLFNLPWLLTNDFPDWWGYEKVSIVGKAIYASGVGGWLILHFNKWRRDK